MSVRRTYYACSTSRAITTIASWPRGIEKFSRSWSRSHPRRVQACRKSWHVWPGIINAFVTSTSSRPRVELRYGVSRRSSLCGLVLWNLCGENPPTLDLTKLKRRRWVTRPRPHIDRIASAWLIKRFIDADAEFLFAPPAEFPHDAI